MTVLFFISIFSSITWVVYIILHLLSKLAGSDFSALATSELAIYIALIVAPVWAVWQIFGLISQYKINYNTEKKLVQLFNQMKKNQDYTDLVVRVMLDAEHEIKDGFVINKFDVFIADMNEILADMVQRCNIASSLQIEQLWAKVKNGERWAIAKTFIETALDHDDFASYLAEKSRKDSVFKGTLLEFCSRYQNLNALLEKHDRDRVFLTILETGVMGKAYSIVAPVVDALDFTFEQETIKEIDDSFDVPDKILEMNEPEHNESSTSLWNKLNPFKKEHKQSEVTNNSNQDADFFAALEKSMNNAEQTHQNYVTNADEDIFDQNKDIPHFDISSNHDNELLNSSPRLNIDTIDENVESCVETTFFESNNNIKNEDEKDKGENNFTYPFGGWINEENYKK